MNVSGVIFFPSRVKETKKQKKNAWSQVMLIQNWLSYKLKYPRLNTHLSASYARLLCKHDAHWQNLTYFVTAVMTNTAHLALCYWDKKLYKQRFVSIYREVRVNIVLFTKSGD